MRARLISPTRHFSYARRSRWIETTHRGVRFVPILLTAIWLLLSPSPTDADEPPHRGRRAEREIPLWVGDAPGTEGLTLEETVTDRSLDPSHPDRAVTNITRPSMRVYRPDQSNGAAVLIAPGGGYHRGVIDKEGRDVARWLNGLGFTAVALKYRLPEEGHAHPADVPLQDAQRALRILRSKSEELGISPNRLGVLGFSAGGHLAGSLAAYPDASVYEPIDGADELSARPDFVILVYPVISKAFVTPAVLERYPGLERVVETYPLTATETWPPTFLVQAADDQSVSTEGALRLFSALRSADVPAELHVYQSGGHGFGIRNSPGTIARWPEVCERWIESLDIRTPP